MGRRAEPVTVQAIQMGMIRSPVGAGSSGPHVTTRRIGTRDGEPVPCGVDASARQIPICRTQSLRPFGEKVPSKARRMRGTFRSADGWNDESVIDTPPHPSSGFRETPDATFPPRGEGSVGAPASCPSHPSSPITYCLLPIAYCLTDKSQFPPRTERLPKPTAFREFSEGRG